MFIIQFQNGSKVGFIQAWSKFPSSLTTTTIKNNALKYLTLTKAEECIAWAREYYGLMTAKAISLETPKWVLKIRKLNATEDFYVGANNCVHLLWSHSHVIKYDSLIDAQFALRTFVVRYDENIESISIEKVISLRD